MARRRGATSARRSQSDRSGSRSAGARRIWAVAGIAVFLLVDAALVAGALASNRPQTVGEAHPIPTFSSTLSPTPTPTPVSTPTPTPPASAESPAAVAPAPRVLVAVSGTDAWRSSGGSCTGADAVVEHSTDGGVTWTAASTSRYSVHTVFAMDANTARARLVGGIGDGCTAGGVQTFTKGSFWAAYPLSSGAPDYVDPSSHQLQLSTGPEKAPCTAPLQVAENENGGSAAALCEDGLYVRAKTGSWKKAAVSDALALTVSGTGFTAAATGTGSCRGVGLVSVVASPDGAPDVTGTGCAEVTDTSQLAVAQSGTAVWLWAGSSVFVSNDSGATWR